MLEVGVYTKLCATFFTGSTHLLSIFVHRCSILYAVTYSRLAEIDVGGIAAETLRKINISVETLPQKCQNILNEASKLQLEIGVEQLDAISITLLASRENSEKLKENYDILKLKQKNEELQIKIHRNKLLIEELKRDLVSTKNSLASQNPNPQNIQECIRQLKQKLTSYEESCEKAQNKLTVLAVPESILPKSLTALMTTLASLQEEASALQRRAEDVRLVKEARDTFNRLRR